MNETRLLTRPQLQGVVYTGSLAKYRVKYCECVVSLSTIPTWSIGASIGPVKELMFFVRYHASHVGRAGELGTAWVWIRIV
jgi:hypothetical protein